MPIATTSHDRVLSVTHVLADGRPFLDLLQAALQHLGGGSSGGGARVISVRRMVRSDIERIPLTPSDGVWYEIQVDFGKAIEVNARPGVFAAGPRS